ncbi:MAG: hypothetical protein ACTSQU_04585 [Promethearchaeota archaeon]
MHYDENTVTKEQLKIAHKFIDSVLEGSQLTEPPKYVIKGLNPNEEVAKLEFQKFEKNEKEIKKIDKRIKYLRLSVGNFVKVVFEFNKNPKKLICMSDVLDTLKTTAIPRYMWSGVLDFPVASSFLFGRVAKSSKHGGGEYRFAQCENLKLEITDTLEQIEEKAPDLFPYKIIESNPFIDLLGGFKFVKEVRNQLKYIPTITETTLTTTQLADILNKQKELIKVLKKIAHFGTTNWINNAARSVRFASEVDVSTIFIPYKGVTYFHIDQFVKTPKKEFQAIYSLLQSLEQLNR